MHLGEVCLLQLSVEYCYEECEFPRMFMGIESRPARDGISKGEIPI